MNPRVGFFDSGVGGLSVARAFLRLRPEAEVFYTADWQFAPYGRLPEEDIRARAIAVACSLMDRGCTIVVVACNTASAVALETLRATFPSCTFVGMEPAVKPAARLAREDPGPDGPCVGVLATAPTLRGSLFRTTTDRFADGVRVVTSIGEGFVELVESGETSGLRAQSTVRAALRPLLAAHCNPVVLGCTHYSALLSLLQEEAPGIRFLDPAPAVARRVATLYDRATP